MAHSTRTSEQLIDVPGGQIYARSWAPANNPAGAPLILLHDSLGCVEMWRDFPRLLCERTGRLVVAYDRLGFGRSSARSSLPSPRFIHEEAEIYLPEVLKAYGIGPFSLFGHSVGGEMSVVAAGHLGDRCQAVISVSAQAFVEEQTRDGLLRAQTIFENPRIFGKLEQSHGSKTRWVLDAWIKVWLSDAFANWSLRDDLPKMHCPVLTIHGDKDEYGSVKFPEFICEFAGGPSEMHVLAGCGHFPHREKPELIVDLTERFLYTVSKERP